MATRIQADADVRPTPAAPEPVAAPPWLPFAVPSIGEEEIAAVVRCLRSGWLTTGPVVAEFESAFADYVGAKHALAVNSCTSALHLALEAVGVGPGDEVITSPMTFTATAAVIEHLGARPVLADCDPRTLNVDPAEVAAQVTARTKAVLPVHFAGQACDMDALQAIADEHGLALVEDAAHALPTRHAGRLVGTIGDVTAFSFYVTKTITTGEGGMITTERDDLADRMRVMRLHGMNKDAWKRYAKGGSWSYDIVAPGFKYNLPDLLAAVGIPQLARSDQFRARRAAIARAFDLGLAGVPGVRTPVVADPDGHAWHLYVIRIVAGELTIDRDAFIRELTERGIGVSVHFIPLHHHSYYRDRYGYAPADLPVANEAFGQILSLPIYPKMDDADVARVVQAVRDV
ncbi:MAG: DegT/DnrJ/EryC1/StrS family aminotransferase, partial [Candidatus Eisenbacteria bacterium]